MNSVFPIRKTYFIPPKMSSKEIVVQKTTFDVGDNCQISYMCMFSGDNDVLKSGSEAIAKYIHGTAGP